MNVELTEHSTSNVQHRTSNNDVAALRHSDLIAYYFRFFSFDVRPARNALKPL